MAAALKVLQPLCAAPDKLPGSRRALCEAAVFTLGAALQLLLQQVNALLTSSMASGRTSAPARELLCAAVEDRQHWLEATRQLALLLHAAADGGAAGIQGWSGPLGGHGVYGARLINNALSSLKCASVLLINLYHAGPLRELTPSPHFSHSPAGAAGVLEVVELLVRLTGKRAGLGEFLTSRLGPLPLQDQRSGASETLLSLAATMLGEDLLKARAALVADGSSAAEQRALCCVQSLVASAAKLLRCMPSVPAVETRHGGRHHWAQCMMQRVAELACVLLVQHPGLVPDPSEQLTEHLRAVEFVGFLCIPGLLAAEQNLSAFGDLESQKRTAQFGPSYDALLNQLRAAGLVDLAVRGGLGALLHAYVKNCQDSDEEFSARSILISCARICQEAAQAGGGHGTSLAIALVKDGLLRGAVERSVWATEAAFGAQAQRSQVSVMHELGIFRAGLATLLREVCSALDASTGSTLLAAHTELLQAAPALDPNSASGLPRGKKWFERFVADPSVWREGQARLLPALEATCAPLVAGGGPLQDGLFRETAAAAAGCSNPGCTCLRGLSEAALPLSICAACREARYCSRQCQRANWARHKPLCKAIQELK